MKDSNYYASEIHNIIRVVMLFSSKFIHPFTLQSELFQIKKSLAKNLQASVKISNYQLKKMEEQQ